MILPRGPVPRSVAGFRPASAASLAASGLHIADGRGGQPQTAAPNSG